MEPYAPPAVIAVVDDDESVRLATASLLRSCGWNVRTYASCSDLVAKLDESDFCLVIADVQMPEMDGFALTKKLAERKPDIPVVFVTAYATPTMVEKASAAGIVGFFTKPLDDAMFLSRVAEISSKAPR
jgi:FixJ family two-component response regulator